MIEYNEVKIGRILNPTSIDLGEFVINPYKGCEFGCLYCYVRSNRTTSREARPWGSYVDARINAPELLEKEIKLRKPKCVLLGSTTECFQPLEQKYSLSAKILEILNNNKIYYTILTRSPFIAEYAPLLRVGFCRKVYFTINNISADLKNRLEPKSPSFELRAQAIEKLIDCNVAVTPYFSPILPFVSDLKNVFSRFPKAKSIEFECLNFNLLNIKDIISTIGEIYPELKSNYEKMLTDREFYEKVWQGVKREIVDEAIKHKKNFDVYIHCFGGYFENKYEVAR